MWPFRKKETRAEVSQNSDEAFIQALTGEDKVSRDMAIQIPSVKASCEIIKNVISSLPIKLYELDDDGSVKEVKDDPRVSLLNSDTKGNMTGSQLKKAIVDNYLLDDGAYIYIEKQGTRYKSLRFVESRDISIYHNEDPIFKDYSILVRGLRYSPYNFIKIIRNTTDGFTGHSLIDENQLMLAVAYNSLKFENRLVKKGGIKKGFLTSENQLDKDAMTALKKAWRNLFSNDDESVVILNKGMEFKESSNTSVEMQLNENKLTNSEELTMLFTIANAIIRGKATEQDINNFVKFCITPIINEIESSLDRDFLLEKEKGKRYWSFDTTEISRGSLKERFEAYGVALDKNFMQVDEVRAKEDLPALGFNFLKMGLDTVLYDVETKTIFTPNTGQTQSMEQKNLEEGGKENENRDQE